MLTCRIRCLALASLCLPVCLGSFQEQAPDSSRQGSVSYGGEILPAQQRRVIAPLLPYSTLDAITDEISGELTMQHIQVISLYHRTEPSRAFRQSAEYVFKKLKEFGLADAKIESFPADGKINFFLFK